MLAIYSVRSFNHILQINRSINRSIDRSIDRSPTLKEASVSVKLSVQIQRLCSQCSYTVRKVTLLCAVLKLTLKSCLNWHVLVNYEFGAQYEALHWRSPKIYKGIHRPQTSFTVISPDCYDVHIHNKVSTDPRPFKKVVCFLFFFFLCNWQADKPAKSEIIAFIKFMATTVRMHPVVDFVCLYTASLYF